MSKRFEYGNNFATTIAVYYNGQSGRPFSYIYFDNLQEDDSAWSDLLYVPASQDEIVLVNDDPDQAWADLDAYISENEYLSERRGDYAERNGFRGPFEHIWDVKFLQDISFMAGGKENTLQFSVDFLNFANLINPRWGNDFFYANDQVTNILSYEGLADDGTTPTFEFRDPEGDEFSMSDFNSRWRIQLGVRYLFN